MPGWCSIQARPGIVLVFACVVVWSCVLLWLHVLDVSAGTVTAKPVVNGQWPAHRATQVLPPTVRFIVNVITYDRPHSLKRLCTSLLRADYGGDTVDLHFMVDVKRPKNDAEATDQSVNQDILEFVDSFQWPYGRKFTSLRHSQAGLLNNVIESWYPTSDDEYVLFAEDDVEMSVFWYRWVQAAMLRYRYPADGARRDPNLFGVSLYSPREIETLHLSHPNRVIHPHDVLNIGDAVYFAQMPCSWGAVYFPEHWRTFRRYTSIRHLLIDRVPIGPDSFTMHWAQSWVKFFYELIYFKGWYMLYPNYANETSFSTNHVEPGVHTTVNDLDHTNDIFTVPLMTHEYRPPVLPDAPDVLVLDLFKQVSTQAKLRQKGLDMLTNPQEKSMCKCGTDCGPLLAKSIGEVWAPSYGGLKKPTSCPSP